MKIDLWGIEGGGEINKIVPFGDFVIRFLADKAAAQVQFRVNKINQTVLDGEQATKGHCGRHLQLFELAQLMSLNRLFVMAVCDEDVFRPTKRSSLVS